MNKSHMETTLETNCKHEWKYISSNTATANRGLRKCSKCGLTQINYFMDTSAGKNEMWINTITIDNPAIPWI